MLILELKNRTLVNANSIASNLKTNSQTQMNKSCLNKIKKELHKMKKTSSTDSQFTKEFVILELETAIKEMKIGKAADLTVYLWSLSKILE